MFAQSVFASAAAAAVCSSALASSLSLDWGSNWLLADGDGSYQDGALANSTSVGGIDISVAVSFNGTANGVNSFAGGSFGPTPFTNQAFFNGDQADGDPALALSDSNSFNNGSSFDNFIEVVISFSEAVFLDSFAVGDVDISGGGGWQDAFAATASLGGNAADVSYNPESNSFFEVRSTGFSNSPFDEAVFGIGNAANDSDDAQFDVSIAGAVDEIRFFYWNGPDSGSSNGRSIYIQDIGFAPVPTPGALALAGIAGLVATRRRNR